MTNEKKLFTSGLGSPNNATPKAISTSGQQEEGSTPKKHDSEKSEREVKEQDKKETSKKKTHKLIVVEDDAVIGNVLTLKLKSEGFDVENATDGSEGITLIEKNKYDLIILDLIMPVMDGFEVLEKLKEMGIKIPVVVMSNLGQQEDIERAKSLGAIDYLIKANTPLNKIVEYITNTLA